ncbi:hypothetical protein P7C70_g1197, partial [Phenoliferia sp. Uapishka_3]
KRQNPFVGRRVRSNWGEQGWEGGVESVSVRGRGVSISRERDLTIGDVDEEGLGGDEEEAEEEASDSDDGETTDEDEIIDIPRRSSIRRGSRLSMRGEALERSVSRERAARRDLEGVSQADARSKFGSINSLGESKFIFKERILVALAPYSKVISPVFEKLADAFPALAFYKVDVDTQEEIAAEVGIKAMPTFLFFKGGDKIGSVVGADPNKLKAAITLHAES